MLKLNQLPSADSSRARTYYVLLSVAPGECAGKSQTCSELAWPRCVGVICAHEDVLLVQLSVPSVQGSHEWGLQSDGAVTAQAGLGGWMLHAEGFLLGFFTRVGRTGLMGRRLTAQCLPREVTGNSLEVRAFMRSQLLSQQEECFVFPNSIMSRDFYCTQIKITGKFHLYNVIWGFPGGSMVKNLPAVLETWARSLGQEDPLEEGMATHSSILAWRISQTKEPGGLQSTGSQRAGHT